MTCGARRALRVPRAVLQWAAAAFGAWLPQSPGRSSSGAHTKHWQPNPGVNETGISPLDHRQRRAVGRAAHAPAPRSGSVALIEPADALAVRILDARIPIPLAKSLQHSRGPMEPRVGITVASAPAAFRVRVWEIMSRGQGLGARRTPPESASVGYSHRRSTAAEADPVELICRNDRGPNCDRRLSGRPVDRRRPWQ